MMDIVWKVAEQFIPSGKVVDVCEYGNGNINDTYLVTCSGAQETYFVLQRINTHVFKYPELIIRNLRTLIEHVNNHKEEKKEDSPRRWDIPQIWKTCTGDDFYIDSYHSFWRAISFVNNSTSYDTALDYNHAREAGYALGRFQYLLSDLDINKMYDTLEGFHITPKYLENYDRIMSTRSSGDGSVQVRYCHEMIESRRHWTPILEKAKERGELQMRVIHGDPKINNFMICDRTGNAVSVIDLDTVKPGLVHYDIGDCLRSSCNPLGEETKDYKDVSFNIDLARSILEGYIAVAKAFLTENDYAYMYDAICLIPFELGLRFFTDYLAGNVYFKVKHEQHNLDRALVQFKLAESIEAQEGEIRTIISELQEH